MNHRYLWIVLVSILFSTTACGGSSPVVGEPTEFAAVCEESMKGKRVAVDGYLRLPDEFTGDQSVILWLYDNPEVTGEFIGVQTRFGDEPYQLDMVPTSYSDRDLNVHLPDGGEAGFGQKVKVSGKVYFPIIGQEFACGLENPLIELVQE